MPNPGRLWELLFPGVVLWIRRAANPGRKTLYDVVGVERDNTPVLMDTQYNNDVAEALIREKRIPGWEDWQILRREVTIEGSRFDLLLHKDEELFFIEVKSCTLFSKTGAMFPDAVTERGRKHILHLVSLQEKGYRTGILFLVQWRRATWFLPDYHTDPDFADTFAACQDKLDWKAFSVGWNDRFSLPEPGRQLIYPGYILEKENHDSGSYMVVLQVPEEKNAYIGALGTITFVPGYYVYVGSAKRNLAARLARHRRVRKKMHWHLDYLRPITIVTATIPIRTADDLEHRLSHRLEDIAERHIDHFGCTDCSCPSHLFYFTADPVHCKAFIEMLEDFRMNRLEQFI
jgi:sugar fermentation stimulation protein